MWNICGGSVGAKSTRKLPGLKITDRIIYKLPTDGLCLAVVASLSSIFGVMAYNFTLLVHSWHFHQCIFKELQAAVFSEKN